MTAAPALIPSSNVTTDVGLADRALLGSLKVAVGGVSTEICRQVLSVALQVQHQRLGALLRAAAVQGLDDTLAVLVGARIDAALEAKPSASFQPPTISTARDDQGRVDFRCALDVSAVDVTIEGNGVRAARAEGQEVSPQLRHFSATVKGVPTPTIVLPQPQMIVNTGPAPTRQRIERDADGEIVSIETSLQ